MNMALPEGIERPTLKVIGNAALWLRALSRRSHKLFIPSLLPEGVQIGSRPQSLSGASA